MSGLSIVGAQTALNAVTGRATQSARSVYVALLTAAPTDSTTVATMTELTTAGTNGYSRQAVVWSAPTSADPSVTSNTATITWGPFTADLGNVTHLALVSSSTGTSGDFLTWWTATTPRNPANGESIQAAAGGLTISQT